jgi:hypothetical protein
MPAGAGDMAIELRRARDALFLEYSARRRTRFPVTTLTRIDRSKQELTSATDQKCWFDSFFANESDFYVDDDINYVLARHTY